MDYALLTLKCVLCGREFGTHEVRYTCPDCGEVGALDVIYPLDSTRYTDPPLNIWQQRDLMPIASDPPPGLKAIGGTPLIMPDALAHVAEKIGVRELMIKNDALNLTGSFKDRASAMVVAHALQNLDTHVIATASTGNAAAALAGCCAAVPDAQAVIFMPASAPEAKIAQVIVFGAKVILVDGNYDRAFDLCTEACNEFGWYNRSTGINPFTTEGKKTVSFEIAVQLDWDVPDVVIVSVGDGSIIGAVYKSFKEMFDRGWIARIPRLVGVQSSEGDALVYAWENDLTAADMTPHPSTTLADSISSELPRDRAKALRAVRDSQGALVRVPDDEILKAIPALASQTGVFAEPSSAIVFAALQPLLETGMIQASDRVLLLVTGSGMKDIKSAMRSVVALKPSPTAPTLDSIRNQIRSWDDKRYE